MTRPLVPLLLALALAPGCAPGPDTALPRQGITTGITMAHVATLALGVALGEDTGCADPIVGCTDFPCEQQVELELGPGCPMHLVGDPEGSFTIEVNMIADDRVELDYDDLDIGIGGIPAVSVSTADLDLTIGDEGTLGVDFDSSDVTAFDQGVAGVHQADWHIDVDTNDTLGDITDDVLTLTGDQEEIGTIEVLLFDAEDVVVDPSCNRNPIAGTGTVQEVSSLSPERFNLTFGPDCDGTFDFGNGRKDLGF